MPIPTRSQSVKAATGSMKPGHAQRSEDSKSTDPLTALPSTTNQKPHSSRLPGRGSGRSIPTKLPSHTRSQSSSLAIPRPTVVSNDNQVSSKPDVSTQAAHTRSRSIATAPLGRSLIQRPQPTQSLLRNPSQTTRASSKASLPSQPFKQTPTPKTFVPGSRPILEGSTPSTSILPASAQTSTSTAASRFEDELIQLAVVHKNAHVNLQNFEQRVDHKIRASTAAIESEEEVLRTAERDQQATLNARALQDWTVRTGNLQDLSFCLAEISDLISGTGSYTTYMRDFEDWLQATQGVHSQWQHGTDMHFVRPKDHLGADAQEIDTRLVVCDHLLQSLQCDIEDRSALAYILKRLPISGMRRAVAESQTVYKAVLSAQKDWIDESISNIVVNNNDHGEMTTRLGLWST